MIGTILRVTLTLGSIALSIPSTTFVVECLSGSRRARGRTPPARPEGTRVTVLVPAHNESAGVTAMLRRLMPQLRSGDQVLVIADNCTDDTAALARQTGAEVLERMNAAQRGKGYALSYAVSHLASAGTPPDVVVVLDADCTLSDGGLDVLAATALSAQRPVQVNNVLRADPHASVKTRIGVFAFRVKNLIRPRGLQRLGFGRQLAGTGMAFPWQILRDAPQMQGHITEDLVLGLELALRNQTTVNCTEALVESDIAPSAAGQAGQRARWEHGHLSAIREYLPRILLECLRQKRPDLLVLGCDLAVPSLAILVIIISGSLVATSAVALVAPSVGALPLAVVGADASMVAIGVATAWWCCGRDVLSVRDLVFGVPRYVLWKLPSYLGLLRRKRESVWVRAER